MRTFLLVLTLGFLLQFNPSFSQTRSFPNAIHAKINLLDYGALYDGELKLSEGFEIGYFRNIAPFLNVGVPFKLGLAKLPLTGEISQKRTVTTSLDLVFHLENIRDAAKVSPYAFAGGGWFMEQSGGGHAQFPFGAGLNFRISKYAFINLQGEFRKALEDNRDNIQLGLGFAFLLHKPEFIPPVDSDHDGTSDALDKCPDIAGPPATLGCPDLDDDADGLSNTQDGCPDAAGPLETNGCPDSDSDGVADKDDSCPDQAGTLNGCPDTDRDGISDKDDACPNAAGPADRQGCPEDKDSDGDGTLDRFDPCPDKAGPSATFGCPDADEDGIADKDDACPDKPGRGHFTGCPDTDGDGLADKDDPCPTLPGTPNGCPDTDGDGLTDNVDRCPTVAGLEANNGCPPVPDSDGDGIADDKDKCPQSAGTAANGGCPEVKKETKERLAFATKAVQFKTGNALLKQQSFAVLDELAQIMKQYPDYKLVINGYTDDAGDEESNQWLSNQRALACRDYLISKGVPKDRLRAEGFGEKNPIASNKTEAGREKNRRVEFSLTLD